jgi:hypothetical protein
MIGYNEVSDLKKKFNRALEKIFVKKKLGQIKTSQNYLTSIRQGIT